MWRVRTWQPVIHIMLPRLECYQNPMLGRLMNPVEERWIHRKECYNSNSTRTAPQVQLVWQRLPFVHWTFQPQAMLFQLGGQLRPSSMVIKDRGYRMLINYFRWNWSPEYLWAFACISIMYNIIHYYHLTSMLECSTEFDCPRTASCTSACFGVSMTGCSSEHQPLYNVKWVLIMCHLYYWCFHEVHGTVDSGKDGAQHHTRKQRGYYDKWMVGRAGSCRKVFMATHI